MTDKPQRDHDFANLFHAHQALILEQQAEGRFRVVGQAPGWFEQFAGAPVPAEVEIAALMSFVELFLQDARKLWEGPKQRPLPSEPWNEVDRLGVSHNLQAFAAIIRGRRLLLINRVEQAADAEALLSTMSTVDEGVAPAAKRASIQKKVCMVGAAGVGKTSLVRQFVRSMFSEKYHSTIGVKIDKKTIEHEGRDVNLILWDMAGEDEFVTVQMSYLRGASGFLLVTDLTRSETVDTALELLERAREAVGDMPYVLVQNKLDLFEPDDEDPDHAARFGGKRVAAILTSAATGENVESAFRALAGELSR